MTVVRTAGGYEFDDDPDRVDRDLIWDFLSRAAYWGRWRDRLHVERQIAGAWRIVGAYATAAAGAPERPAPMVGFARAISDGLSVAYLADVFVVPEHRGHGVGVGLVAAIIEDGPGARFRWMLHTGDAHGLYERFGFAAPDHTYLERPSRRPA